MRIKTHKVCSYNVFRNQFSHKNKVGMGTEGLRRQYHGKRPHQGWEYCTEPGGGGWQGTHIRLPLVSLGKCLLFLQYSKLDAAHILSDSGHQK